MFDLAFRSAKLSYFLLYCLSLPLILEMNWILNLWLANVPEYTTNFTIFILIFGMLESISIPLQYMNQATGNIKVYQLVVGGIQLLNFPIAYLLLYLKFSPDSVYVLAIIISQVCLYARLLMLRKTLHLPVRKFLKSVYFPILSVSIIGVIIPLGIEFLNTKDTFWIKLGVCIIGFISAVMSVYYIGCTNSERNFISEKLNQLLSKFKTKHA